MQERRATDGDAGRRGFLTYANVMATIAVFGVLAGGGAYAASKIGPNDIKRNAVRGKHIKKNQVRGKHIKNGQVRASDLGRIREVRGDFVSVPAGSFRIATAECPRRTALVGGGFSGVADEMHASRSLRHGSEERWIVTMHNGYSFALSFQAIAYCLRG